MATPTRNEMTTVTKLKVDWLPLAIPTNGYSEVVSYALEWDQGNGIWAELTGLTTDSLSLTYSVVQGVVPGNKYLLRVRARNSIGWGPYSEPLEIKAATWPEIPTAVTTEVE
jgi:hypothetical protein